MFSLSPLRGIFTATRKTFNLFWHDFKYFFIAQLVLLSILSVLGYLSPAVFALILNSLTTNPGFTPAFNLLLVLYALTSILPYFFRTLSRYLHKYLSLKIEQVMEFVFIKMSASLDVAQHEDPQIKDLLNKVSQEGQWRIKSFADRSIYIFEDILSLAIASVILFQAQWWMLPLLLLATIPELIISNKYGHQGWSITSFISQDRRMFWELKANFTSLSRLLELKLFQNNNFFQKKLQKLFDTFIKLQVDNEKSRTIEMFFAQFLAQLAVILVIFFFIYQVVQGSLLIGTLTFLIATVSKFRNSLSGFFSTISGQYEDSLFVNDLFDLDALPQVIEKPLQPIKLSKKKIPTIEFKNVTFKYPGTKKAVLKNISFTLNAGEKLALVGVNGAGKTTLVKLLCRFYDPTSGQILIGGFNLKQIDLDSWYYHLGIIFQEYTRYRLKTEESIYVGRTTNTLSKNDIIKASKHAGTHDFIKEWPLSYQQQLGKEFTDGVEPSVGQWQKLALARVFYRNPSIFVLDEPTSSMDAEAEAKIFKHLETHEKNKSAILISHRFSTVRNADKIIVIKNGLIAEQGSHQQLMEQNEIYARLFNLQAKSYQK